MCECMSICVCMRHDVLLHELYVHSECTFTHAMHTHIQQFTTMFVMLAWDAMSVCNGCVAMDVCVHNCTTVCLCCMHSHVWLQMFACAGASVTRTCTHTSIYAYIVTYMPACTPTCIHTYIHTHLGVCVRLCACVCACVCVRRVCICVYVCVSVHVATHTSQNTTECTSLCLSECATLLCCCVCEYNVATCV